MSKNKTFKSNSKIEAGSFEGTDKADISSNTSKTDPLACIEKLGHYVINSTTAGKKIVLLNIIGEIEGHEILGSNNKTSKYENILPMLAMVENSEDIDGLLVLLNTVGGDVEAGLAIAEMIASISKPKVCLVLGGGHSIGVPLAVSGDVTFIAPTATMIIHPIRITGTVLGVKQNFEYIERMQERIINFTAKHSKISEKNLKELMFNTKELTKDVGSVLIGNQAVDRKIIDSIGGIKDALKCLYDLIIERNDSTI